jgi:hypothetical protein
MSGNCRVSDGIIGSVTARRLNPAQIEIVDEAVAKVLRKMTGAQRVAQIVAAHRTAKLMLRASIKQKHPEWDDSAVHKEVVRRLTGGTT